jgi:hypothetical protein
MLDETWPVRLGRTLAVYAAWLASSALLIGVLLTLRGTVRAVFLAAQLDSALFRFVDSWTFVLFAVPAFGVIMFLEHYYRQGGKQARLVRRFTRVTIIELALAAFCYLAGALALH